MDELAAGRQRMTRDEALSWNSRWSVGDVRLIGEHLDRTGAEQFYRTASNGSVTALDAAGRSVMHLYPGYITFAKDCAPPELAEADWKTGLELSCFQRRGDATAEADRPLPVCPSCFLALPATGVCDDCD
ncbi:hypothetical protein [Brachybacterium sp. J153]|uniref:hypothetical protein n=1 Tax=Brachybacterium sp. J153 TaxID=3116488 RepID=UPI002E77A39C|nr:hypothetical protein [Brachybacterium sp. J153]MEE1617218.1 hypothetical protein [Brachybacterium sp. J153]